MPTYLVLSASILSLHIKRYWIDPTYTFNIVAKRVFMIQRVVTKILSGGGLFRVWKF